MSLFLRAAAISLALLSSSAASGAWHEARSKHFVIYADESPKALLDYATKLERFDAAVRTILMMGDPPVGDGNRLTVFVMPTDDDVRKLAGDKSGFISGFYTGRATGPLAYVPKRTGNNAGSLGTGTIFYHEYAHHLMMQQLDHPYPEWYVEGFAEFLSTPLFDKDGSVGLGSPPQHRAWGLFNGKSLPLETLIGGTFSKISKQERESIYGRGWLLVHYLAMGGTRKGQLDSYITAIAKGTPPPEAAMLAFGDLKQLDKELDSYLMRRKLAIFRIASAAIKVDPIEARPLTPGGAELILLRAKMKNGVGNGEQEPLAASVRLIQSRFPGDELVELTLAEAELNAGKAVAAQSAADRALKANPKSTEAMVLKGRAIIDIAINDPGDQDAAFSEARRLFIGANKIDPEDPEPLMEFYKAFLRQGVRPTANAIAALHYASDLAPQDLGLRMNSAVAYLNENKLKEARVTLTPVAYSPHGGGVAEEARRMIERIDAGDAKGALHRPRPEAKPASEGS